VNIASFERFEEEECTCALRHSCTVVEVRESVTVPTRILTMASGTVSLRNSLATTFMRSGE